RFLEEPAALRTFDEMLAIFLRTRIALHCLQIFHMQASALWWIGPVSAIAAASVGLFAARSIRVPEPIMHVPQFQVDPFWPKPLPNHWIVGAVVGVDVDERDHVWIVHRPSTLQPNETRSIWRAAPPVIEFDADGTMV